MAEPFRNAALPLLAYVRDTAGNPYNTSGTPPTFVVVQLAGSPATVPGASVSFRGNGWWRVDLTATNMDSPVLGLSWSGTGVQSDGMGPLLTVETYSATVAGRIDAAVTSRLAPAVAGRTLDVDASGRVAVGSIVAAAITSIWSAATRTLTADPSGVTTLLERLTGQRSSALDNLTTISTQVSDLLRAIRSLSGGQVVAVEDLDGPDPARIVGGYEASVNVGAFTTTWAERWVYVLTGARAGETARVLGSGSTFTTVTIELETPLSGPVAPGDVVVVGSRADVAVLSSIADIAEGGVGGTLYGEDGAITFTYTVTEKDGTTPLPGAAVYVSADEAGAQRSQVKLTDELGRVTFRLDAGPAYFWRSRSDRTFVNPDAETVGPEEAQ